MTKRSPILGYNHNVRYRGLVFHVQTEDSGVLSPHLFTHLFHEGVIVSTRKLVYDAGAAEDAIKALMQAQHKAVMKDLKNGSFDEKIDQYLGGTPGLEPSKTATAPVPKVAHVEVTPTVRQERAETDVDDAAPVVARAKSDDALTTPIALEFSSDPNDLSSPIELPRKIEEARPEEPPIELPAKPRTKTAERGSKGSVRFNPPPPPPSDDIDPPTLTDDPAEIAAAIAAANQSSQPQISRTVTPAPGVGVTFRKATPPPVPARGATPPPIPQKRSLDSSSAEISLSLDDGESQRNRVPRDTNIEDDRSGPASSRTRPPSHGAATLPPAKKPSRPAITPPNVVARPITNSEDRSGAVEIYAPAPASVEPPPGERSERPGQYSVNRQRSTDGVPMKEKTGRIAALTPSALPVANRAKQPSERPSSNRIPQQTPIAGSAIPQPIDGPGDRRSPQVTAPIANRSAPQTGSGVVMTRPAVIVGAPQKPAQPQAPRVRKAREDEGRGFGQGLISEKSLDEVILAYLSEDGDDK